MVSMFKLIFQSYPIGLIFGQIAYWDDTRQWIFYLFDFSIITVITIFYEQNGPRTVKKWPNAPRTQKIENQLKHASYGEKIRIFLR